MSERSPAAPTSVWLELTAAELELVQAALRLLISTLGREEADELAEVQAVLARVEASARAR